jgi:hypothetical protein
MFALTVKCGKIPGIRCCDKEKSIAEYTIAPLF